MQGDKETPIPLLTMPSRHAKLFWGESPKGLSHKAILFSNCEAVIYKTYLFFA